MRNLHIASAFCALALASALLPSRRRNPPRRPLLREVDRPIRFSGLNWESNLVLAGIERYVLEHGYGCKTTVEIGETLPMLAALQRGDVDVTPEVWPGQIEGAWKKALASGRVLGVGHVYDAGEGWYVPRYTVERHPDLKAASDLARFKDVFADPEDPGRGRIYGCPAGWACGTLNDNLLRALGLDRDYALFAPGSGAAQKAAIVSAHSARDIVSLLTPTSLVGALTWSNWNCRLFDQQAYTCMTDPQMRASGGDGVRFNPVVTGLNAGFAKQAPSWPPFAKLTVPEDRHRRHPGLAGKRRQGARGRRPLFPQAIRRGLAAWMPADTAARVQAALAKE